jgi:hypothetical protein
MTAATDESPTRRAAVPVVDDEGKIIDHQLIVEITSRTLSIRPKRSRRGGESEVTIGIRQLYDRLVAGRAGFSTLPTPRRRRRRAPKYTGDVRENAGFTPEQD